MILRYFFWVLVTNISLILILFSFRKKIGLSHKGLQFWVGLTFILTLLFPLGLSFLDFGWVLVLLMILGGVGFAWLILKDQPRLELESLSTEQIELVTGPAVNLNDRIYRSLAENEIVESEVVTLNREPKIEEPLEEVIEAELIDEEAETEAIIKEPTEEEVNPEEEISIEEVIEPEGSTPEITKLEAVELDEPKVEEILESEITEVFDPQGEEPIEEVIEAELIDEDTELIDEEDEAETEAIIKEPTEEEINPEEEIEMAIRSQWLENFIGYGFKAKMQGKFEEAILFFSKARTLCTEPKLDMLLTLELSIAYREQGRYFEAIEVLRHYIADQVKGISETFYKEVRNQIIYLEIIQYELNTLGMPNLPYNEIPRLNKVKIEEIFISLKL